MSFLRNVIFLSRKGNLSIRTVSLIVLGLLAVSLIYVAANNWMQSIGFSFVENVEYPSP